MGMNSRSLKTGLVIPGVAGMITAQEAPMGSVEQPNKKEAKKLAALKGQVEGMIVWVSSRSSSKHAIWIMHADGTNKRQLTR